MFSSLRASPRRKPKTIIDDSLVFQHHFFLIFKNGFGNCIAGIQQLNGVTTRLTRPHFSALCASTGSAVNDTCLALCGPITRGSFCDNPCDGNIPNLHQ